MVTEPAVAPPEHVTNHTKCWGSSRRNDGRQCRNDPLPGSTKCRMHIGNKKARANAAVRAELSRWSLGTADIDPAETLLRLLSQSRARVEMYAARLETQVVEHGGDIVAAMVADSYVVSDSGALQKVGEYIRGLAQLEADERDRCAQFARLAIAAGLAERQVRVAEQQGAMIASLLRAVLSDPTLQLTDAQRAVVPAVMRQHLSLAPAG